MNLMAYFQKLVYLFPCLRPFPIFFYPHIPIRDIEELKHRRFLATLGSVLFAFMAWFCPHFWATYLYKSKETQQYKFGSVKGVINIF